MNNNVNYTPYVSVSPNPYEAPARQCDLLRMQSVALSLATVNGVHVQRKAQHKRPNSIEAFKKLSRQ
jgi:hypothetical protein